MPFPVKVFQSSDAGAPVLSGSAGSLVALLDACLITGYNVRAVDSLTWASGVATATVNGGHGFARGDVITIAGASEGAFNGDFVIKSVTTTAFQFDVPGTGLPATVLGGISAKKAPVGSWSKPYTGTAKAVYRSDDVAGLRHYLRVDDTDARYARVRGFVSMTDADTGIEPFPFAGQLAAGLTWAKSTTADAAARDWVLVGDSRAFWLFRRFVPGQGMALGGFGDLIAYRPGDPFASWVIGSESASPAAAWDGLNSANASNETAGRFMPRAFHAAGTAVRFGLIGHGLSTTLGASGGLTFPNLADGSLLLSSLMAVETGSARGVMPGLWQPLHTLPLNHGDRLPGLTVGGLGREVLLIELANNGGGTGRVAVDVTGPWR